MNQNQKIANRSEEQQNYLKDTNESGAVYGCNFCARSVKISKTCSYRHKGYKHSSLLYKVDYIDVVPDMLHLKLRICDKFLENLIRDLLRLDNISNKADIRLETNENLKTYFDFFKKYLKVNFKPNKTEIKGQLKIHRQLTGGLYNLILKNMTELLPLFDEIRFLKKIVSI